MRTYCRHKCCRIDALQLMHFILEARGKLSELARYEGQILTQPVTCNRVPRKGAVNTPFHRRPK